MGCTHQSCKLLLFCSQALRKDEEEDTKTTVVKGWLWHIKSGTTKTKQRNAIGRIIFKQISLKRDLPRIQLQLVTWLMSQYSVIIWYLCQVITPKPVVTHKMYPPFRIHPFRSIGIFIYVNISNSIMHPCIRLLVIKPCKTHPCHLVHFPATKILLCIYKPGMFPVVAARDQCS